MARHFAVLALIFFAVVGMASAASPTPSPDASPAISLGPASDNNIIGTTDGGSYGAAPAGGPGTEGAVSGLSPSDSPKSDSTTLEVSTLAGGVVSAVVASFFF